MPSSDERSRSQGDPSVLRALGRWWDKAGREDPLYAILTEPEARGGGWDEDRFFATGRTDVEDALERVRAAGRTLGTDRALDFGCGVGRLTQALAARFDQVDGVDIAPSMIAEADRYNRSGSRCRYHVNARADLSMFDDDTFDLVFSLVVLQHIPPELARGYVAEFIRVLRPDGLAVFQIATAARVKREPVRGSAPRRLARRILRRPPAQLLEMHATPEAEVRRWVDAGNGVVVATWALLTDEYFDGTLFAVANG
jgi:SAM-dependent methyltransferase